MHTVEGCLATGSKRTLLFMSVLTGSRALRLRSDLPGPPKPTSEAEPMTYALAGGCAAVAGCSSSSSSSQGGSCRSSCSQRWRRPGTKRVVRLSCLDGTGLQAMGRKGMNHT